MLGKIRKKSRGGISPGDGKYPILKLFRVPKLPAGVPWFSIPRISAESAG